MGAVLSLLWRELEDAFKATSIAHVQQDILSAFILMHGVQSSSFEGFIASLDSLWPSFMQR